MADSGALRVRRATSHARGDHSLCKPERCAAAPRDANADVSAANADANALTREARLLAERLNAEPGSPKSVLVKQLLKSCELLDATPSAASAASLATEIRRTILALEASLDAERPLDAVDELHMRRAIRRMLQGWPTDDPKLAPLLNDLAARVRGG